MNLSKQLRIFLLHARRDETAVYQLYHRLVQESADIWLDREKLLPGQDWAHEIRNAIYRSDLVIVCLSRRFNQQGGFRHQELKIALERANSLPQGDIFIIPARLERCELPEALCHWHCVDLFEEDGYQKLLVTFEKWLSCL